MILDRLTKRARAVLTALASKELVPASVILSEISKSNGMSKNVLQELPKVSIPKTKKIKVEDLVKEAHFQSLKFEHSYVGTEHLLLALLKLTNSTDLPKARLILTKMSDSPFNFKSVLSDKDKDPKTPFLDGFGENLTRKALIDFDKELVDRDVYDSLVASLLLKTSPNVLLVGEPGVGKRTLVELLARNISSLEVPTSLVGYKVVEFDILAFMTNILNKGNAELGLSQLIDELKSLDRVILYVKNFQNIFYATAGGITVPIFYSMFLGAVTDINIRIIATINTSLFEKFFADNEHILEDFSVVDVTEPDEKTIKEILKSTALYLSSFHNITIPETAISEIYRRSKELSGTTKFPKKAVDLMDHCCSYVLLKKNKIPSSYKNMVDESFILLSDLDSKLEQGDYDKALSLREDIKVIDGKLLKKEERLFLPKIPIKLTQKDVEEAFASFREETKSRSNSINLSNLSNLSAKIKQKIVGQNEAVDLVTKSLVRSRLGLRSKKRPLGNFLFLGPTGVGKTELAKVLAESFFGDKSLIRLDMSDFSEKHTVARLVGAPPGYVGYGEGGELTSKIDLNPNSVVLFDEIEKAHPDVLNILLQIMEEGELTDAKGVTFDFSKAVIILTSNLGTEILHNAEIGFGDTSIKDSKIEGRLKENLKKILKPELLNRFDEIIIFKQLGKEEQLRVLNILINEVVNTLKDQDISLTVSNDVKGYLLKEGYSKEYGARSLRRTMERKLLDCIAEFLLKNTKRPLKIKASLKDNNIVVK